jgi:hypothetical protein
MTTSQHDHDLDESLMRYVDEVPTTDGPLFEDRDDRVKILSSRFDVVNEEAIPVYERASSAFSAKQFTVSATPVQMVGRRRGRKYVALSCPGTVTTSGVGPTTPKGFAWSHERSDLDVGIGFQMNPGDAVEIDSEAEIYVAALPGNTTGVVQYLEVYNVLAGPAVR